MVYLPKNIKSYALFFALLSIFIASFILGLHNASLYKPKHGFDGEGHVFYIEYINQYKKLPAANLGWETHQSPLYYILGATLMQFSHTSKTAQYMNIFILWATIGVVAISLHKVFKNYRQVFVGVLALAALPMLNIFPPMVTNELLSLFWIISCVVAILFLVSVTDEKKFLIYSIWFTLSFALGFWTKVSIIMILPVSISGYVLVFIRKKIRVSTYFTILIGVILVISIVSAPILLRSKDAKGPSNIVKVITTKPYHHSPDFYYRLDWIPKVDMYNTQYYSLIGGAWNSFWSDGHNAVTPFVKFHKKAFILWCLGFVLLPTCLYGLLKLKKYGKNEALLINILGVSMLLIYIYYNVLSGHYSAARLTYEMGIILTYAFGLASAARNKWVEKILLLLLTIQFTVMVSFFWILPWWFVTR